MPITEMKKRRSTSQRVAAVYGYGGFDLLVADADVVWRASPWPLLYAPERAGCELQAMRGASKGSAEAFAALAAGSPPPPSPLSSPVREPHPSANCAACLNAGFLFLRGGRPAVGELLRRWSALLRQRRDEDHNQKWLNWVLATGGELRPHHLGGALAPEEPVWAGRRRSFGSPGGRKPRRAPEASSASHHPRSPEAVPQERPAP